MKMHTSFIKNRSEGDFSEWEKAFLMADMDKDGLIPVHEASRIFKVGQGSPAPVIWVLLSLIPPDGLPQRLKTCLPFSCAGPLQPGAHEGCRARSGGRDPLHGRRCRI